MEAVRQTVDILLVEDDPNDAELTIRELKKNNIINNIVHLKNGDDAIRYFFEEGAIKDVEKPRVIFLDLKLPKVSGIEVLRTLKANVNTRTIPIIVMTSSKVQSDLEQCYDLGANSYIVKPVEFEGFAKVVKDVGLYWMLVNTPPLEVQ